MLKTITVACALWLPLLVLGKQGITLAVEH